MKRRIAVAAALKMEMSHLIADEPTTARGAAPGIAIIGLLKDLQQQTGCSVPFISHQLGVIAEFCGDAVVMHAGEIVERGTTRRVFPSPAIHTP